MQSKLYSYIISNLVQLVKIMQNIQSIEKYEFLVFRRNICKNELLKALDVVKNYIIKKKLILTGGMAIDLALRKKGSKLYDEDVLPDYDFYSPDFQNDAYAIGKKLCLLGLTNISIINAAHSTTMRVRVNYEPVADITYIPPNIYKKIPVIKNKDGIIYEHPHYKMINIHTALSYPYANSPFDVILQRFDKDMKRFDILYELYPVDKLNSVKKMSLIKIKIPKQILKDECVSGFAALYYWNNIIKTPELWKKDIEAEIPHDANISLLSDNPEKLRNKIKTIIDKNIISQNYNALLDNVPQRMLITISKSGGIFKDKNFDLLDNRGKLTTATKVDDFWVANLQFIMSQFLIKYILYDLPKNKKSKYIWGYQQCYNLFKKVAEKYTEKKDHVNPIVKHILPTYEVYGSSNINRSNIVLEHKILEKIGERTLSKFPERPIQENPTLKDKCVIRPVVKKFQIDKSWLFEIDGSKRDLPLEFIDA